MDKKNVNALKSILSGKEAEKNISVGYTGTKKEFGDEYEQKNGYKVKKTRFDDIRVPMFCPKCEKVMKARRDTDAFYSNGTCLNCMIDYHDELRKEGKLDQFMFKKRLLNAQSWLDEQKTQLDEFKNNFNGKQEYVLSDGRIEKWEFDGNLSDVIDSYKEYLGTFEEQLNNSIQSYEEKYGKLTDE